MNGLLEDKDKRTVTFKEFILIMVIALILDEGFSITINDFHYEFKGFIAIIFKIVFGIDFGY